jgi:predicted nucleic acid-binding protein
MDSGPAVLDTDTLSELCRGQSRVTARASAYLRTFGRLTTTAITVFERRRGYQLAIRQGKPFDRQLKAFEALVSTCIVLPFDDDAAAIAAAIWASVARAHRQHLGDILIAAVACSRRLPLITRNRRDFDRLSKAAGVALTLIDWTKAASTD